MSASILVAFATRYGSTREAAEQISATFRALGFEARLQPMQQVQSVEGYDAIVLGAPLQIGRWHGDAHHFLSQYREALTECPVAIFALGPLHAAAEEMKSARQQLDKELAKYPWLKPVATAMFVGKFDPLKVGFPLSTFMKRIPATNEMDLAVIREWAGKLPATFALDAPEAKVLQKQVT